MKIKLTVLVLLLAIATSVAIGSIKFDKPALFITDSTESYALSEYDEVPLEEDPCFLEREKGQLCTFIEMDEEVIEVW
jgi:hypothetical protein